jgi:hypothetical protein
MRPHRMKRVNLYTATTELEGGEPDGYLTGGHRFGKRIGASMLGGTIYDIPAGHAICARAGADGLDAQRAVRGGLP